MRTIFATENEDEFAAAWERLADGGIPVFEPSKYYDVPGLKAGSRQRVLAIWLDHQYEDAVQLLRDPAHVVAHPVDIDDFSRLQEEADGDMAARSDRTAEKALNWFFAFSALAILGGVAYIAMRR